MSAGHKRHGDAPGINQSKHRERSIDTNNRLAERQGGARAASEVEYQPFADRAPKALAGTTGLVFGSAHRVARDLSAPASYESIV